MAHQPAAISQYARLSLWTLATIAAIASASAFYFALRAHQEHLRAAALAAQLSAMEQELPEKQSELEKSKSALARLEIAAKQANRPTSAPTIVAAPSSSLDSQAQPGSEAYETWKRQNSLAILRLIYDPLLTQLNLFPEQRARFYELRLAAGDDSQGLSQDSEKELRNLLGAPGFQLYKSYARTEAERMALQQFRRQVDASLQIADWQYDRLQDALIQAQERYPRNPGGAADSYDVALAQAAQFLTPDQLESARNYFHTQADVARFVQRLIPSGIEEKTPPGK